MSISKWLHIIIVFILVCCTSSNLGPASAQTHQSKDQTADAMTVKRANVKKALSSFVFGIREEMAGCVLEHFQPFMHTDEKNKTDQRSEWKANLNAFFEYYSACPDKPLLYTTRPSISWSGDQATIRCMFIWNLKDQKGEKIRWKYREELTLSPVDNNYVITSARKTPLFIQHFKEPEILKTNLQDIDQERRRP